MNTTTEHTAENSATTTGSPLQKGFQKYKKIGIYAAMFLVFAGVMYLIFAPNTTDAPLKNNTKGINVSIPQAMDKGLWNTKKAAYEQQLLKQEQERKKVAMATLSDLFEEEKPEGVGNGANITPKTKVKSSIGSSVSAYKDIHRTLGNFYEKTDTHTEELQAQIEDLKSQLEAKEQASATEAQQLALLEKSYQMAAKYLPQAEGSNQKGMPSQKIRTPAVPNLKEASKAKVMQQQLLKVVSSLQASNPGQSSFFTAVGTKEQNKTNTIRACIHRTVQVHSGETVQIRLLEATQVGQVLIPAQTILTATTKLRGNRLLLSVQSVQYKGMLLRIKLSAFDLDGQEGLFVPGTLEQNATKEILSSMGRSSGTSFTLNNSASQQLLTDVGKGVLEGTSNYLQHKIQDTKITVKAGHSLLLLSEKN